MYFFDTFLGWWPNQGGAGGRRGGSQNFKILRECFQKWNPRLKFSFAVDFHLSITICTWNTSPDFFWPSFGLMTSTRELKETPVKVISKAKSSLQCFIKYLFRSFHHSRHKTYNFELCLPNMEIMTSKTNKYSKFLKY